MYAIRSYYERRPEGDPGLRELFVLGGVESEREPEVRDPQASGLLEQNVFGFEIAVNQASYNFV